MYECRFYQACVGQTQLVYKVGWGYNGFKGENLKRAEGLKFFFFFFFPLSQGFVFFLIMRFQ